MTVSPIRPWNCSWFSTLALVLIIACGSLPAWSAPAPPLPPDPHTSFINAQSADIDWSDVRVQAAGFLSRYLAIDTTNPPGRELEAARFFDRIFRDQGLEGIIDEYAPGRANFMVRLKGDGSLPPIILTSHSDVVPAEASQWEVPPFSGNIQDGFVWGRGALDMKDNGIVHMMTILLLKRQKVPLSRDVIFLLLADEEVDSSGARRVLETHPEWVEGADFLLNEGDNVTLENGKPLYYGVAVMEKSPLWLRLITHGEPGHGSEPGTDGAVDRLVKGLHRLQEWERPMILTAPVKRYFADIARYQEPDLARAFADMESALRDPGFRRRIAGDSYYNAVLNNTIALTGLNAGQSINVIPSRAEATLDCRLLPGQSLDDFLGQLKEHLADPMIETQEVFSYQAQASPMDTELFHAISRAAARHDPGVPVTTPPLISSTDSHYFRSLGITCYGFEPFRTDEESDQTCHGHNERISLDNLEFGCRLMYEIICDVAGRYDRQP